MADKLPMFPTSAQAEAAGRCVLCLTPLPAANPKCLGSSHGHSPGLAPASSRIGRGEQA